MKLRRIELEQVRKFEGRVAVEGLGDGLNLIVGANEAGKTTLLAALQAGLFLKHGSRRAQVLRHHRNETAPRIALDLEVDGELLRFEKRFLQRPQAVLRQGGLVLTGDAAEQAVHERLCGPGAGSGRGAGIWSLLLVDQGRALQHAVPQDAQGVLQTSLEAQLDDVTGGGSVKRIIARLDERLTGKDGLVHLGSGRPKGRLRELDRKLAELDQKLAALRERQSQLAADGAELEAVLAAQAAPDGLADLSERIQALEVEEARETGRAAARTRAAQAALALHQAEAARAKRADLVERHEEAAHALGHHETDAERRAAERDAAQAAGEALAAEAARLAPLLQAGRSWLGALEEAERLKRAAAAGAAEVTFDLAERAQAQIRLNGSVPPGRRFKVKVGERLAIDLEGIGRIEVRAAGADGLASALRAIEARAAEAAEAIVRSGGETPRGGQGLSAFRDRLAGLGDQHQALEQRLEEARTTFREARAAAARAAEGRDQARCRLDEVERQLEAARAAVPDDELEAAFAAAREAVAASPPVGLEDERALPTVRERLHALRHEWEALGRRRAGLQIKAAQLSGQIAAVQGHGLDEEIAELERQRFQLDHKRADLAREVEVLTLLRATLIEAESEVRRSYTQPLVRALQPALDELLPGTTVAFDDSLQIATVRRTAAGVEPFAQLSHGTREQIAVAVRLAFAEVLVAAGRPCFVVLDDALVFSDDDRLQRMFRVLERAAEKVQILILTCRERAFRPLRARRLEIVRLDPAPADDQEASARRLA